MKLRFVPALALAFVLAACASATGVRRSMPLVARDWLSALAAAKAAAHSGHYDDADRALYDYQQRYQGTEEAREAVYWRAVFKLDPENRGGSARAAAEQLDSYLADTTSTPHRAEALVLRRLASAMDSLGQARQVTAGDSDEARAAAEQKAAAREEELQKQIKTLKEQLDKTTAELERIKKRLTDRNP
ncbi:MAG TPA: hypothetical protein VFS44_00600 [Gemmatimonadaceae bacterium]|nr:hypothetical protein [Gemmatimonadaceae bacterium]